MVLYHFIQHFWSKLSLKAEDEDNLYFIETVKVPYIEHKEITPLGRALYMGRLIDHLIHIPPSRQNWVDTFDSPPECILRHRNKLGQSLISHTPQGNQAADIWCQGLPFWGVGWFYRWNNGGGIEDLDAFMWPRCQFSACILVKCLSRSACPEGRSKPSGLKSGRPEMNQAKQNL